MGTLAIGTAVMGMHSCMPPLRASTNGARAGSGGTEPPSNLYMCHVCADHLMQLGRARPVSSLQGLSRLKPMSIHNNNELGLRAE